MRPDRSYGYQGSHKRPEQGLIASIERLTLDRLKRKPNWDNPTGYNDKIQWLKVYDQTPLHVNACDKLLARDIAQERAGDVLIPLFYAGGEIPNLSRPHYLKTNHDSGTVCRVFTDADYRKARAKIIKSLARTYGTKKGEWAYWFIEPKVMAEDWMPSPVIDYKFHCVHGRIRWVQVIRDRISGHPKETIFDPDGNLMLLHMDHKMRHDPDANAYPGDSAWEKLTEAARKLADGWRYVRVDLYFVKSGPFYGVRFGELTFWPLSGCYRSKDEPVFGEMLDIDLSYKRAPIVA